MSRKATREAIAAGLANTVAPSPFAGVYNYTRGKLDVDLPALVVSSAGLGSDGLTFAGTRQAYRYHVMVFVPRGTEGTAYDEQDADDLLDDCADAIEAWVGDNPRGLEWSDIDIEGDSNIQPITLGGVSVWLEIIPLRAYT